MAPTSQKPPKVRTGAPCYRAFQQRILSEFPMIKFSQDLRIKPVSKDPLYQCGPAAGKGPRAEVFY